MCVYTEPEVKQEDLQVVSSCHLVIFHLNDRDMNDISFCALFLVCMFLFGLVVPSVTINSVNKADDSDSLLIVATMYAF